ncbi:MAG: peroxisome assembly protein (Peroxin-2) [Piccolia ochrophora]|nr:MAG: peroxisome assembly protein (Peroxin-2) [Piccolia ochrophora]
MTTADFSAAQQRLAERRRLLHHDSSSPSRARASSQHLSHASTAFDRLPPPLHRLGQAWTAITGREGTRPAFRVGQIDAELLDDELLELLKGQVGEGLKYFGVRIPLLPLLANAHRLQTHLRDDYTPEISLALRALLFKLSFWDHSTTYGAALQNLRYTDARSASLTHPPPTTLQKSLYGLFTVAGPYTWHKWETHLLSSSPPPDPLLPRLTNLLSTTYTAAKLGTFLLFLLNGRHHDLLSHVLRVRLVPRTGHVVREVSFEYLNRQLVWHAFTEFLLFVLPLVGISRWRRWATRAWRKAKSLTRRRKRKPSSSDNAHQQVDDPDSDTDDDPPSAGELSFLPEHTCPICFSAQTNPDPTHPSATTVGSNLAAAAQTSVTNPYAARPCGCVYCYVCIAQALEAEEGEGWVCLRCGAVVRECEPWRGDVVYDEGDGGEGGDTVEVEREREREREKGARRVGFEEVEGRVDAGVDEEKRERPR